MAMFGGVKEPHPFPTHVPKGRLSFPGQEAASLAHFLGFLVVFQKDSDSLERNGHGRPEALPH